MKCKKCGKDMEMRRAFGRDHHWHCEDDGTTVMVADRLSEADRENFPNDESAVQ
jgi:hypothetical protein